jgi:ketosteroid isomerase-like protein
VRRRSPCQEIVMSKDERAIRELVTTWMAATKAGDLPKY